MYMTELYQTRYHKDDSPKGRGNAFATCMACIMDLNDPEDMLQIQEYYSNDNGESANWEFVLSQWLEDRGWEWTSYPGHIYVGGQEDMKLPYIVVGYDSGGNETAAIYENGEMVFNPNVYGEIVEDEYGFEMLSYVGIKGKN